MATNGKQRYIFQKTQVIKTMNIPYMAILLRKKKYNYHQPLLHGKWKFNTILLYGIIDPVLGPEIYIEPDHEFHDLHGK